eukprot:1981368-Rhodomonas_salina.1
MWEYEEKLEEDVAEMTVQVSLVNSRRSVNFRGPSRQNPPPTLLIAAHCVPRSRLRACGCAGVQHVHTHVRVTIPLTFFRATTCLPWALCTCLTRGLDVMGGQERVEKSLQAALADMYGKMLAAATTKMPIARREYQARAAIALRASYARAGTDLACAAVPGAPEGPLFRGGLHLAAR